MARLDDLLSRVLDEMPSVPKVLALRALSDSVKEFCDRTHAWQEAIDPVRVRAGRQECEVNPPQGTLVASLLAVRRGSERLTPIYTQHPYRATNAPQAGRPRAYTQVSPTELLLDRVPLEDEQLTATAALTLVNGNVTATIPDGLFAEYGEAIANGAKMRLARQATQPWAALDLAAMYGSQYYTEVNLAKQRVNSALGAAQLRASAPRW